MGSLQGEQKAMLEKAKKMRLDAISRMNQITGFDVVIVCCTSSSQSTYWNQRLNESKGSIAPKNARIYAVEEDWSDGGAGNGLGTLYAWQKACMLDTKLESDLAAAKIAVGLYHTAGKGTRLAPMPGSECNNKPAVKLPALIKTETGTTFPLTILEAVIKQTGVYANSRKGRLSVFWGDQVFIPSVATEYTPTHHADILARLGPMPDKATYNEKGLFNYGLICVKQNGDAIQVEKVEYDVATSIGSFKSVGTSVGSFSVSSSLLVMLMREFSRELTSKKGKMDTDPHFWMPMTLDAKTYASFMLNKKEFDTKEQSDRHYDRIKSIKEALKKQNKDARFFGSVDVGQNAYWWDYGQVGLYMENNLKLLKKDTKEQQNEAHAMKMFLGLDSSSSSSSGSCSVSGPLAQTNCCVSDVQVVKTSSATNSVLSSVTAGSLSVSDSILVNVTANNITANNCLLYNVADKGDISLGDGSILVGMTVDGKAFTMTSKFNVCGKKNWDGWSKSGSMTDDDLKLVKNNLYTYAQIYSLNKKADVSKTSLMVDKQFEDAKKAVLTSTCSL